MALSLEIEIETLYEKPDVNINILDSNCDYNTFFKICLNNNIPCIIKNVGLDWSASNYWVIDNKPNLPYLLDKYGNSTVTVYNCNKRYYNSQETQTRPLKSYIENWIDMSRDLYYIKDWHLQNEYPTPKFYEVPIYFASDWLNEFLCENDDDDYRFVYMGPVGTWTPFHVDVFTSYSWSINICGQKKWVLFPPGEEDKLRDTLGNLPYDLEQISLKNYHHFEVIQNSNEAIFIPSGWYHQVWNTKDTISINHNWINACNIKNVWKSLKYNLAAVEKEIEDCRDMDNFQEHCQIMLKASYGLDFEKFYQFLKYITIKRINFLENDTEIFLFGRYKLGRNQALYDLNSIKCVLTSFICSSVHENLNNDSCRENKENLLEKINVCLDSHY